MNIFDVRVYAIRRRTDRRRPFEVRWHAAGRTRSRSFITRGLADSYRAELVGAARKGLEFDPATGEPVPWATPPAPDTTWYQHAVAYVDVNRHLSPCDVPPVYLASTSRRPAPPPAAGQHSDHAGASDSADVSALNEGA